MNEPPILDLTADHYNRYPSEQVQFFLRVSGSVDPGATLSFHLPDGMEWQATPDEPDQPNSVMKSMEGTTAQWELPRKDFGATAVIQFIEHCCDLPVRAVLCRADGVVLAATGVRIHVETQSRLMRFLPEIYQDNELLGRFLLGFESFWNPIEGQINNGEAYYDPWLTPAEFLPWLATWLGAAWDERLPEDRRRLLLSRALELYQRRGTRQGLELLLRLYTGGQVKIVEHRAKNLTLGPGSRMGYTHALGRQNSPHTLTVIIHLPCGNEQYHAVDLYRRRIEALIETQKPAHTAFRLQLMITDPAPAGVFPTEDH